MSKTAEVTLAKESLRHLRNWDLEQLGDTLRHEGLKEVVEFGLNWTSRYSIGRLLLERLAKPIHDSRLATSIGSIALAGPTGLAAGWDKTGRVILAWQAAGANFVQPGGIPRYEQPGNPMSRLMTLDERAGDHGIHISWNNFGFSSPGAPAVVSNINRQKQISEITIPVLAQATLNKEMYLRKNKHKIPERIAETVRMIMPIADGIELGLSSNHTPGMRASQDEEEFVYRNVMAAKEVIGDKMPLGYKGDGDGGEERLELYCRVAQRTGLDWLSLINATGRPDIKERYGLSPSVGSLAGSDPEYQQMAVDSVAFVYEAIGDQIDIVAMGGADPEQAIRLIKAGGSAVGRLSGVRVDGLQAMSKVDRAVLEYMQKSNIASLTDLVGTDTRRGAKKTKNSLP